MAETGTPGTFIPHDTAVAPARAKGGGLNDLFLLCGIVLLVASGALAAGVFLYAQFLQSQSASKVQQLQRAEAAFEPSLVEQITRLDDRMHAADTILGMHIAPTAFFSALDQATLQTVSFDTLKFDAPDPQHITLTMQGVAQSVNSIALQAELFSKNGVITNPIFSNIARQSDGVHFNLTAAVNPAALNYESYISAAGAAAANTSTNTIVPGAAAVQPASSVAPAPSASNPFGGTAQTPAQNPAQPQSSGDAPTQ